MIQRKLEWGKIADSGGGRSSVCTGAVGAGKSSAPRSKTSSPLNGSA